METRTLSTFYLRPTCFLTPSPGPRVPHSPHPRFSRSPIPSGCHTLGTTYYLLPTTFLLLLLLLARPLMAQMLYNPNDERFKSLYLEKVQSDYKVQKDMFDREKIMHDKGLISEQEFEQAESMFKTAQITYQQAILSLAFEQPHITIDKAVKYQSRDGKTWVKLTLRNTTGGLIAGEQIDVTDLRGIRTDQIANVYVSLLNDQRAIVSQPYEAKIPVMQYNKPVIVTFTLLQNLDYVIVKDVYADKSDERKILLQMDESANRVLITSDQFSQEADLGSQATYNLTLSLFSGRNNIYKLALLDLPRQMSYDFLSRGDVSGQGQSGGVRLSQVKFSQDVNSQQIALDIYVPDRYDSSSFLIDQPIEFFAVAIPPGPDERILNATTKFRAEDLDEMHIGYIHLELVPRGVGRMQLQATNYYLELKPGETARMKLTVLNDGTRELGNVRVRTDMPINWVASIKPDIISVLSPDKEENVLVSIAPPANVDVGDYEATIKADGFAGSKQIETDNKSLRIHVAANANVLGTALLILLVLGILSGVVIFGIRLSKR